MVGINENGKHTLGLFFIKESPKFSLHDFRVRGIFMAVVSFFKLEVVHRFSQLIRTPKKRRDINLPILKGGQSKRWLSARSD